MNVTAALAELVPHRTNEIVVTTMGATREWSRLSNSPFDFHYLPSAMGQAPMIALGIALAQPQREVIVLNGDGSLLMNLGCLVTIVASGARNYKMILLDNGVYEVTGGQGTAAWQAGAGYSELAYAAGISTCAEFSDLENWKMALPGLLIANGPCFISLRVEPVREDFIPRLEQPMTDRVASFRKAIASVR
jgi:thiamine pyrophosphate-dependent acetolactate synthase large subunit-like protein